MRGIPWLFALFLLGCSSPPDIGVKTHGPVEFINRPCEWHKTHHFQKKIHIDCYEYLDGSRDCFLIDEELGAQWLLQ